MTRKKLNLDYISNYSVRKRTFNLRTRRLLKKLDELKNLCDVDVCAVIYNPYNSAPEVWPSNSEVQKIMDKFEEMPEDEHTKKSINHEEFLTERLTKVKNQVKRLSQDNNDKLMKEVMFSCLDGNMGDLVIDDGNRGKLCEYIEGHLMKLHHHRQVIITSNQGLEHVPSLGNNFMSAPIFNQPQVTNEMQQPITTSNQGYDHVDALASSLLPFGDHGVNTPVMNQDEIFYPLNQ